MKIINSLRSISVIVFFLTTNVSLGADRISELKQTDIEVTLVPDKSEIMLGEPIYLSFVVKNKSNYNLNVLVGGDYRNSLGRPESFSIKTIGEGGKNVLQPKIQFSLGGIVAPNKLPSKGSYTFRLFLPNWAEFEDMG